MSERILYGDTLAKDMMAEVARHVHALGLLGREVHFSTILVGDNPASRKYIEMKQGEGAELGIHMSRVDMPADTTQKELEERVTVLSEDADTDAVLMQYPLPNHLNYLKALQHLNPVKDVDGLHPANMGLLFHDPKEYSGLMPCTPKGILDLLKFGEVPLEGADITIVGRGLTVGAPLAALMTGRNNGPYATVTAVHRGTHDIAQHTKNADIVIAAAGKPNLIDEDMVKEGSTLVAVGVQYDENGTAHGDFTDLAQKKAAIYVPVTRGVGPLTRANLWKNAVYCHELRQPD